MVVLKQLGAGPELVHCHVTLTLEVFMNRAMIKMGVGGAGVVQLYNITYTGVKSTIYSMRISRNMSLHSMYLLLV